MSIDFKIQNACDHMINWEAGQLQSDRKSVLFLKPIATTASLSVRINNVLQDKSDYVVAVDMEKLSADRPFFVVMHHKVKNYQPLIEAQYVTLSTFCRKCLGLNYVDDIEYMNGDDLRTCNNEELLLQMMEKFIVTKSNSNPFHSWLGTGLHELIGTKITDNTVLTARMTEQVNNAIEKLKNLQRQAQASGREMTPGELFGDIKELKVTQGTDPSIFTITVRFTSQRGQQVAYELPVYLAGFRRRVAFS